VRFRLNYVMGEAETTAGMDELNTLAFGAQVLL